MNAPSLNTAQPSAVPATSAPATAERSTVTQRASALKERLESGSLEAPATEAPAEAQEAEATAPVEAQPAPADDAVVRARAERLERIRQVREKERQRDAERQQRERYKVKESEIEQLRKKVADLEPLNGVFTSEESLLAEAERRGMSAQKLVEWMRTRLTDPQAVAQRQAQSVEEKLRAELAKTQSEIEKLRADMVERERIAQAHAELRAKTDGFISGVEQRANVNPLTAAFLRKHGAERLVLYANQYVAPYLPEDYTLDELFDHFEQHLDETQLGPASPPPANGNSQPPKKNGAAEPTTTLSNAVASGRESLVESIPLHKLSREERRRMLREKLEREG
jgi:hypothetical protein